MAKPVHAAAETTVSDLVAAFFEHHQIRHVFGIIGAGNAQLFDAIERRGYTQIVCVHHEQAAVMAMGAYFRICGTISAALLTTGAGSANGVTGVLSCYMDSIPGLILSGNERAAFSQPKNPLRIWGVQGFDSVAMVAKFTKWAHRLQSAEESQATLEKAYTAAGSGRPGPVWLDMPMDLQVARTAMAAFQPANKEATAALPPNPSAELAADVQRIAERLQSAERPLLWLGHGIRLAGAVDLIGPLLECLDVPALVSWAGMDMVDTNHPLIMGRAGVYGQRHANLILQNCDFLLAIGTRLAMPQVGYAMPEFARDADLAIVDIDANEVNKFGTRTQIGVCADAKAFVHALLEQVRHHKPPKRAAWHAHCRTLRSQYKVVGPEHTDEAGYINSYPFMQRLSDHLSPKHIVVTDMGTALLSGHQVLQLRRGQRMMTSTGLGEMGFGLPAAIGASFAAAGGEVLCLNCDGGMMINLQELQTIVHHRLPIKIIVFNNDGYLMIKHTQKALFEGRFTGTDRQSGVSCPDYQKLAAAFGIPTCAVRTWRDFDQHLLPALKAPGPGLIEVFMHPEQPLVPKLAVTRAKDGSLVSPPLEDLSPLIPRADLRAAMLIGLHPKSESL